MESVRAPLTRGREFQDAQGRRFVDCQERNCSGGSAGPGNGEPLAREGHLYCGGIAVPQDPGESAPPAWSVNPDVRRTATTLRTSEALELLVLRDIL